MTVEKKNQVFEYYQLRNIMRLGQPCVCMAFQTILIFRGNGWVTVTWRTA